MNNDKLLVDDIPGIGPVTARALAAKGFYTAAALARASVETLADVPGFGAARAVRVKQAAASVLANGSTPRAGTRPAATSAKVNGDVAATAIRAVKKKSVKRAAEESDKSGKKTRKAEKKAAKALKKAEKAEKKAAKARRKAAKAEHKDARKAAAKSEKSKSKSKSKKAKMSRA